METIIRIKRNKPAFKALVLLAKELEKNDHSSISITYINKKRKKISLIEPVNENVDPSVYFGQLLDFPSLDELRSKAWPKI